MTRLVTERAVPTVKVDQGIKWELISVLNTIGRGLAFWKASHIGLEGVGPIWRGNQKKEKGPVKSG
ncbi:MAG: hypothetical protein Q7U68_05500 [Candidatus Roizmanbacteria bacterium]|nr:hypothetical protein [Candidatus Roizmanbacteria bacterium]